MGIHTVVVFFLAFKLLRNFPKTGLGRQTFVRNVSISRESISILGWGLHPTSQTDSLSAMRHHVHSWALCQFPMFSSSPEFDFALSGLPLCTKRPNVLISSPVKTHNVAHPHVGFSVNIFKYYDRVQHAYLMS